MRDDLSLLFEPFEAERRLLDRSNETAAPFSDCPVDTLIWDGMVPADAIACIFAGASLTRREVLARASALAARLGDRGVGRGAVVAIIGTAGWERLVAVLAVLRAGAVFLPIDPDLPEQRIEDHIRDSGAALALVTADRAGRSGIAEMILDEAAFARHDGPAWTPPAGRSGRDAAYIVYTSGTTGRPKAAINAHRALTNRLEWMARDIVPGPGDRILHKTPFGFDVAIWEQLLPLLVGTPVVIAPEPLRHDPDGLAALMTEARVTIAHFVPTPLAQFVDSVGDKPASLRCIVTSGEALPVSTAERVMAWPDIRLHNYYGPSEAAIDVTATPVARPLPARISIGVPIQNCRIHILDAHLRVVPPGTAGELYIGGVPVGGGYLGRARLTAERFIPDPFGTDPGARLYRTGDLASWTAEGEIAFLGRADRQLKINGLRIEPGEIEAGVTAVTGRPAVVDAFEAASGARVLAAFVAAPDQPDLAAIRAHLAATLPSYMIPALMFRLDAIPLAATGKADRAALARICEDHWRALGGGAEQAEETVLLPLPALPAVREAVADLLKIAVAGPGSNFFQLGGDSIIAIRLVARLRAAGWAISVQDIFDRPVLADLAGIAAHIGTVTAERAGAAAGLRDAAPALRALLSPQCLVPAPDGIGALTARVESVLRAVGVTTPVVIAAAGGPDLSPARVLSLRPEASTCVAGAGPSAALVAFAPDLFDDPSMEAVAAYLTGTADLPRWAPAPQTLQVQDWTDWAGSEDAQAERPMVVRGIPLPPTAARGVVAERRTDALCHAILTRLSRAADAPITALLPQSPVTAIAAGLSPEAFVGRLAMPVAMTIEADTRLEEVVMRRLRGGQVTARCDVIVRLLPPGNHHAAALARLAAPASVLGMASLLIDGEAAWIVAPDSWNARVAALCDGPALAGAIADAMALRYAQDFPLAGIAGDALPGHFGDAARIEDIYPLAPLQEGMLVRAAYWPESDAYLNQNIIDLFGPLDRDAFALACRDVVLRYEALRTGYRWQGLARPLAVVSDGDGMAVDMPDWSDLPPEAAEDRLADLLARDRAHRFDLTDAGLCRIRLVRFSPDHHVVVWTHHHILLDGWCLALIWGDIARCYAARRGAGEAPRTRPRPFRDYIAWLRDHPPGAAQEAFWRTTLNGAQPTLLSARAADVEGRAATVRLRLDDVARARLVAAAAAQGLTTNSYIQAAWSLMASLRTGNMDVVHGVSISGRPPELQGSDGIVGLFINLIPLRLRIAPEMVAADFLREVQAGLSAAIRNATLPLPAILAQWRARQTADDRLFDSLIAFENYPDENLPTQDVAGIRFQDRICDEKTEFPIGLIVLPGDPFEIHLNYDEAHFDADVIGDIGDDLFALLDRLVTEPDAPLARFFLPSARAREPAAVAPPDATIGLHTLTNGGIDGDVAMIVAGTAWSYAALRGSVARTAARLDALPPGTMVPVLCERGAHHVVAVLACWRGGLVPVPVNPALPDAQIATILESARGSAGLTVLVSDLSHDRIAALADATLIVPDIAAHTAVPVAGRASPPPAAAILHTSGTTGAPRPVIVPADGFLHRVAWTARLYGLHGPVLLANAAPGFDIGLWEIAWPLATGGTLVIASDDEVRDPRSLVRLIEAADVDAIHVTPTYAAALLEQQPPLSRLRLIVTGGETVQPALVAQLRQRAPQANIWQGYGPTEASVSVTDHAHRAIAEDSLDRSAIGAAMPGCVVRLLDASLRPVPPGGTGTIHIGGAALSRGYLRLPRETAAAFIPDPHGPPGARLFNTGDLGRRRIDGELEHLGRADRQVKIRGIRVQPEAVEAILRGHPAVRHAVVLALPEGDALALEAFVVADRQDEIAATRAAIAAWQEQALPPWSRASRIHIVPEICLTRNGKADRAALIALRTASADAPAPIAPAEALRGPLEGTVALCWEEALGERPESRHANFFAAGGHSITAMRMIAALQRRLPNRAIAVPWLFKFPTVAGLAEAISERAEDGAAACLHCLSDPGDAASGPPLVLIHPVEGLTTAYRPLARLLPHRAIYAMDDPRIASEDGHASIEAMATLYLEWVRARLGDRPFMLGGWSFGGSVAMEMAAQMIRHDAPPAALFLIDSHNLAGRPGAMASLDSALAVLDDLAETNGLDAGVAHDLRRTITRNAALATRARPCRYGHRVHLFVASEQEPEVIAELGVDLGWSASGASLHRRVIAGNHRSIWAPDRIADLASALDEAWP